MNGQNPNSSPAPQISVSQIQARLQPLVPLTKWIRSYGSTNGLENIPSVAKSLGFKVAAGAWISSDGNANAREINNLIANANAGYVDVAIVGSEAILRNDVSVTQLIAYINQVRQAIPAAIPVGTADVYGTFLANPSLIAASDLVLGNFHPFWEGARASNAICSLESEYQELVNASAGKPVWISETGWPSDGDGVGAAFPDAANANSYALQFLTWANANGISAFYFEAYDEAWKTASEGPQGGHWGLLDSTGIIKPGMDQFFDGGTSVSYCVDPPGRPLIYATYVPPYGSTDLLEVQTANVSPSEYVVATYIQVNGGWWSKPTLANPTVPLNADGTAKINITTGGNDQDATSIYGFIIPSNITPPQATGGSLPAVPGNQGYFTVSNRTASSISGVALDTNSTPIPNAIVDGGSLGAVRSAKDGRYSFFDVLASGSTTLSVTAPNYVFSPTPVTIGAGNTIINLVGSFLQAQSVSPASGEGTSGTFTFTFSGASGTANIAMTQMLVNSAFSAASACYITVYPASRTIYLYNDAGTSLIGPATLGQTGSVSNTQCTVNAATSNVSASGSTLAVTLALTFGSSFTGGRNIFALSQTAGGQNTEWQTLGSWTVGNPITEVSVSPSIGAGPSNTFSFTYSDAYGAPDIAVTQMLINGTFSGPAGCYVTVYPGSQQVYLYNDAATSLIGPVVLGGTGSISNRQCTVSAAGSSLTSSGDTLTVNLGVSFSAGFSGLKEVYSFAQTSAGVNSGWYQPGLWTNSSTPPQAVSVSPPASASTSATFSFTFSDVSGASAIAMTQVLINTAFSGARACYVTVYPASRSIYLYNDDATSLIGPVILGGTGTINNSQCTVSASGSSITASGNTLTVNLVLSVAGAFPGAKNIYGFAQSVDGLNAAWQQLGTWSTPNTPPQVLSVSPSGGSGSSGSFLFTYSDTLGAAGIGMMQMLINDTFSGAPACYITVFPASRTIYLYNDAGTALIGPVTLGGGGSVSNSQCTVSATGSNIAAVGANLSVTLSITFAPAFGGAKNIYGFAQGVDGLNSLWQTLGVWTAPLSPPQTVSVFPSSGIGSSNTFTFSFYDPSGSSDIGLVQMLFNSTLSSSAGCYVTVYPGSRTMYLYNDAGTALIGPVTFGGTGTLNNSQCTITAAYSTLFAGSDNLAVNLSVSFPPAFAGVQNIYGFAQNVAGQYSAWTPLGNWKILSQVRLAAVSPSFGVGSSGTFTITYADPSGPSDIAMEQLLINNTFSGAPACYITVFPAARTVYLYNDGGTALIGPITIGGTGTVSNSQCTVSATGSSITTSSDTLSVALAVNFLAGFDGAKVVYSFAQTVGGLNSSWQGVGTWTVP